ncbi:hypothetical protein PSA01_36210 [Pseudonocardia saturnea]|nr:hypothetical protein Pdca_50090 [Pseudonocardia autotrophica]GEC26592.1 hypothetical protein PSA01_36210 [Pseudonocardia saturnea]
MLPLVESDRVAREMHALSEVLFLLDACVVSVAALTAARVAFGRPDDQLYAWAAGVVLSACATFAARVVPGVDGPLFMRLVPVLSIALVTTGFAIRGSWPERRGPTGGTGGFSTGSS